VNAVREAAPALGVVPACAAIGLPRATFYRHMCVPQEPSLAPPAPRERALQPRALTAVERTTVLELLHSERFVDQSPAEIHATLLEEHTYHCAVRTMYRVMNADGEVRERRDQLRHPAYTKPELLATAPNQVWSWDITKLLGPGKWTYFYLYVIIDIFSRYVVGWMLAYREQRFLAQRLIRETCVKEGIEPGQLALHADRGQVMRSKAVSQLLTDLEVSRSHSRPYISDDNPYSESQFKTMKYRPDFPDRFASFDHARAFCGPFFDWYNREHRHSGIAFLTPEVVHRGRVEEVLATRQATLDLAYAAHPERFVRRPPQVPRPPEAAWINRPESIPAIAVTPSPEEVLQ
jgi:putative transposase